jgi:hypothetical protein
VIFMRAILKAYGVTDRVVWACDSFEGLPKPDETAYPQDRGDIFWTQTGFAVSLEQVQRNFARYGLLIAGQPGEYRLITDTIPAHFHPLRPRVGARKFDPEQVQERVAVLQIPENAAARGRYLVFTLSCSATQVIRRRRLERVLRVSKRSAPLDPTW